MQSAEIELKFPVHDLVRLQSRLPGLGFQLDTPRALEQNTLYDTPNRALRASRQILRLRRYGNLWTLTHKRPADLVDGGDPTRCRAADKYDASAGCDTADKHDATSRYKVRIETETPLDDGPALAEILHQLGYEPVFRYEKFRAEWSHATSTIDGPLFAGPALPAGLCLPNPCLHLVLDETPIGVYAELEGAPAWIDETLAQLEVDPGTCLTDSYGRLFLAWKQRTGSLAEDLTFDQVQAHAPSAALLQPMLG